MIQATGNLWSYPADFRVITTNGSIRRDGCAVLGRGCAKEATARYPNLARELGVRLKAHGVPTIEYFDQYSLFAFPVKHRWMESADLDLIRRSTETFARHLLMSATYVMPRAGCGNGRLHWDVVEPVLAMLPDNVVVIDYAEADV